MTRKEIIEIAKMDSQMALDILQLAGPDGFDGTIGEYEELEQMLEKPQNKTNIRIEIEFWNADTDEYEWREFFPSEYDELKGFEISKKFNLEQKPTLGYEVWDIYNGKNPKLVATFLRRWQAEKFAEHHADIAILIRA